MCLPLKRVLYLLSYRNQAVCLEMCMFRNVYSVLILIWHVNLFQRVPLQPAVASSTSDTTFGVSGGGGGIELKHWWQWWINTLENWGETHPLKMICVHWAITLFLPLSSPTLFTLLQLSISSPHSQSLSPSPNPLNLLSLSISSPHSNPSLHPSPHLPIPLSTFTYNLTILLSNMYLPSVSWHMPPTSVSWHTPHTSVSYFAGSR